MNKSDFRKLKIALQAFILGTFLAAGSLLARGLPLSTNLVAFNSSEGRQLLLESQSKADFWDLSIQFVTQINQAYCGVASMVMVLNGLDIPAPETPQYEPYRVFTQENFFSNEATRNVLAPEVVSRQGITLEQLGQFLESYSVEVEVYHGGDVTLEQFRRLVVENLKQPDNFVLANYLRREIEQERGGHISPIAAYNERSDRFLILDVARYKYPPVWVKAEELWKAMATFDSVSGKTRGFLLVQEGRRD
ncbi:MAG: phytochelatin synthase family protein [Cyanobacteriota bacterium]|nr:phytochelatin synthase family protein [Cyanobacteriota bacterium]